VAILAKFIHCVASFTVLQCFSVT